MAVEPTSSAATSATAAAWTPWPAWHEPGSGGSAGIRGGHGGGGGGEDAAAAVAAAAATGSAAAGRRRGRSPAQSTAAPPNCQVEGCGADLSCAKGYHRRHRVCEVHSKTPRNMVNGVEQRFCQQCSRFHSLAEFDEGKRSCRRRLAGHNERRRRPPHAADAFTIPAASVHPHAAGGGFFYSPYAAERRHLLDGNFLLGSNSGSIWPGAAAESSSQQQQQQQQQQDWLQIYRSRHEMLALQERIASQGVHQFLRQIPRDYPENNSINNSSRSSSSSLPTPEQQQQQHQHPGALSLLSPDSSFINNRPGSGSAPEHLLMNPNLMTFE